MEVGEDVASCGKATVRLWWHFLHTPQRQRQRQQQMVHITRAPKLLAEPASMAKTHIFYYQQELAAQSVPASVQLSLSALRLSCLCNKAQNLSGEDKFLLPHAQVDFDY